MKREQMLDAEVKRLELERQIKNEGVKYNIERLNRIKVYRSS